MITASSGIGKTQMAFNLQQAGVNVVYVSRYTDNDEGTQYIYLCFKWRTLAFHHCILSDVESGSDQRFLYSLVLAVLNGKERWEPSTLSSTEARRELSKLKKENPNRLTVVFEDEFPNLGGRVGYTVDHLWYMRTSLLEIGIPVIAASTNSSALNAHQPCMGREQTGWCTVFPLYSTFVMPPNLNELPPWLLVLLRHSRPLFAETALTCYRDNIKSQVKEEVLLELVVSQVAVYMTVWKPSKSMGYCLAQLCILLSAHSIQEKVSSTETRGLMIDRHYANLDEETNKPFNLTIQKSECSDCRMSEDSNEIPAEASTVKKRTYTTRQSQRRKRVSEEKQQNEQTRQSSTEDNEKDKTVYLIKSSTSEQWNQKIKFLGLGQDLLLHFGAHGLFQEEFWESFEAVYNTLERRYEYSLPIFTTVPPLLPLPSRYEDKKWKVKVTAALVLASRSNQFRPLGWSSFLSRFVEPFRGGGKGVDLNASQKGGMIVPSFLENSLIPFLGFPSIEWPEEVVLTVPAFLGTIRREGDSEGLSFDLLGETVAHGKKVTVFTVEVLDHHLAFGDKLMQQTFKRRPEHSPIHIIVVKSLVFKEYKSNVGVTVAKRVKGLESTTRAMDYHTSVEKGLEILGNTFVCRFENGHMQPIPGIPNSSVESIEGSKGSEYTSAIIVVPLGSI